MARQLLGVALLSLIVGACSSSLGDPGTEQGWSEGEVGSINLPLTTTTSDQTTYRLRVETITITGQALGAKPRVVKPLPDAAVHNEPLPVGSYAILLEKGWVLEKRGPADEAFSAVAAQLVTPNPVTFDVNGKVAADAFFGFVTTNGDVSLGQGGADNGIGVQDCRAYDSYTASLGALTVECLGTADPRAFKINADGFLVPTFDECTRDASKLTPIRQLLSLQYRSARLPLAKQCIAGRYDAYLQKFAASGIEVCPSWGEGRVINPITADVIDKAIVGLPELPAKDDGRPLQVLELLEENSLYPVFFDQQGRGPSRLMSPTASFDSGGSVGQSCATPADCATACAGGFPGFVLGGDGDMVLTDPVAWLIETIYASYAHDPYLRVGYYHPMSYHGNVPGVQFGDYNRFAPCGDGSNGVICPPEACSYFNGIHVKTRLQADCLDPANIDTCVSFCGPPLP